MANPKTFTKQQISTTSDQDALQIKNVAGTVVGWIDSTGTGQGNLASGGGSGTPGGSDTQVQFNNTGSFGGSANLSWDNTNNQLSVGGVSSTTSAALTIVGAAAGNAASPIECHSSFANGVNLYTHSNTFFRAPSYTALRSRGTQLSPSLIQLNDQMSYFSSYGYDGSAYAQGATMEAFADETWSTSAHGTRLEFYVTTSTSTNSTLAMVIKNNKFIGINTSTPSALLSVGTALNSISPFQVDNNGNITEIVGTAATSGVSQSSPTHTLSGTYWTGAASATDSWTIQNVVANGTNGTSTLTFGHSGSTGTSSVSLPGPVTPGKFTVAGLPTGAEGQIAYATNGRKVGEGGGAGTGVPVYFSNGSWRVYSTDAPVAS
jgi:hypothetical protein